MAAAPAAAASDQSRLRLRAASENVSSERKSDCARKAPTRAVIRFATAMAKVVATIPTGKGHHELAFSPDSRYAYATNRGSGTVSVIDVRERKKVRDVPAGKVPISMDYSVTAGALYVADGEGGTIFVVDGKSHEVTAMVQAKPGLGPMRFTPDGRWGLILNSREDAVHIVDASTNKIAHTVAVGKEPFQMVLSRSFAHVRCLGSEQVYMVNLIELGKEKPPPVNNYPAGAEPPNAAPDLGLARELSNATGESEVLVVNPANRTTYFYMEGMNAPSGTFKGFGQSPRAVETAILRLTGQAVHLFKGDVEAA